MRTHKGLWLLILVLLYAAPSAVAQEKDSDYEFFGGFSYLMTDLDDDDAPLDQFDNLDGFNVSLTRNLTKRFGITGDFSAHFRKKTEEVTGGTLRINSRSFNYYAGPQYKFRNHSRATPFLRALAGVANNRFTIDAIPSGTTPPSSASLRLTDFALMLGGGLDIRISKHVDLRVFQIDYNPVFVRSRTIDLGTIDSRRLDNVRFSIGVVIK